MNIAFFGTPDFAIPPLDAIHESHHEISLVVAQPDRRAGRGMKMTRPPVARRAIELGLSLEQPRSIRKEEFHEVLRDSGAEVGVVVAYGKILPASLLEIPPHGFINIHASLLPHYRGAAPIQRAIEAGETSTGVTIMKIDEELDHGPILSMVEHSIGSDSTSPDLFEELSRLGGEIIVEALDRIESGDAVWTEQNHDEATFASMIDKSEGRTDFHEPARALYDRFRAFQPWPGITVEIAGEEVKLREIEPGPDDRDQAPGTVVDLSAAAMTVSCSDGTIVVRKAQRPGRRPVSGGDLARSFDLKAGDRVTKEG